MRARLLFNLALIAGVIALAGLWWATRPVPAPEPDTVSAIPAEDIRRLEVHAGDDVIVLERDDAGRWRLVEPVAARADPARVAALLQLAGTAPERHLERDAVDPATTGMDDPPITVRFNDEAPIAVGGRGPSSGSRYVRTAHALLLVRLPDLAGRSLDWASWIDPAVLADDARPTRLTLPTLTLDRAATGGWRVQPAAADRGADYAQATVEAWRHARALAIEPADASRERSARVTLRFADRPERHLDVIQRTPELVLRDPQRGIDYHLAANQAEPLLEMRHPDTLGRSRAGALQPSAIPLNPDADGQ